MHASDLSIGKLHSRASKIFRQSAYNKPYIHETVLVRCSAGSVSVGAKRDKVAGADNWHTGKTDFTDDARLAN